MPQQADRRDRIAGRVDVGNALLQQGALSPALHLCVRIHQPTEHGPFQHLAPWPSVVVPALSPTILRAHMLVGAVNASNAIGCVVDNVKAVVGAASAAVVPLENALAVHASYAQKKLPVASGSVCASTVCRHV